MSPPSKLEEHRELSPPHDTSLPSKLEEHRELDPPHETLLPSVLSAQLGGRGVGSPGSTLGVGVGTGVGVPPSALTGGSTLEPVQ